MKKIVLSSLLLSAAGLAVLAHGEPVNPESHKAA